MATHYLGLLNDILTNGVQKGDRTGTGTLSVFGRMYRHDLNAGFPLLTTKKLHIKSILYELLWFLQGGTNTDYLNQHGVTIWDEWATETGELGPIYGAQWRSWRGENGQITDQVTELIAGIRANPNSRRHIINAWHVSYLPDERKTAAENIEWYSVTYGGGQFVAVSDQPTSDFTPGGTPTKQVMTSQGTNLPGGNGGNGGNGGATGLGGSGGAAGSPGGTAGTNGQNGAV